MIVDVADTNHQKAEGVAALSLAVAAGAAIPMGLGGAGGELLGRVLLTSKATTGPDRLMPAADGRDLDLTEVAR